MTLIRLLNSGVEAAIEGPIASTPMNKFLLTLDTHAQYVRAQTTSVQTDVADILGVPSS